MTFVTSFDPVASRSARILVLGSMPGVLSLKANQYYAHPRNAFWPIMAGIFGFNAPAAYPDRLRALRSSGVALWDVLRACIRPGSLDSSIERGSRVSNDFTALFRRCPGIRLVCFNGVEARRSFDRHVLPALKMDGVRCVDLPSTSPAHAALSLERKAAAWRAALGEAALGEAATIPVA